MLISVATAGAAPNAKATDTALLPVADAVVVYPASSLELRWCPEGDTTALSASLKAIPRGLVIDVGAYDGENALEYATAGHEVYAFEPSPSKAPIIEAAFRASPYRQSLRYFAMAASNVSGTTLPFYVSQETSSRSATIKNGDMGSEQDMLSEPPWPHIKVEVPVTTLDESIGAVREVVYAKLDAQGHDHEVLMGAAALIRTRRLHRVAFEVSPGLMEGSGPLYANAIRMLAEAGYVCYDCPNAHGARNARVARPAEQLIDELAQSTYVFKGTNVRGWTDLVCFATGAETI